MTDCAYAGPRHPATHQLDGYTFCVEHALVHDIERIGAPLTDTRIGGPRAARSTAVCGTEGGHTKHRRLHEAICDPCRHAHNAYTRDAKRAARKRQEALRTPHPVEPTAAERLELVRQLTAQGRSVAGIARAVRRSERTVERMRVRLADERLVAEHDEQLASVHRIGAA